MWFKWFKSKQKNRRLGRVQVLDVKSRSSRALAARVRLGSIAFSVAAATIAGLFLLWQGGQWALKRLVYENKSFAIRNIDIQTDGMISVDLLRRWCAVKPGENLLALDLAHVKHNLEQAPVIQSASVERILPGTLRIRVSEREPVAQVTIPRPRTGGGIEFAVFQLDAEGYLIQPLDVRQTRAPGGTNSADENFPVITGLNTAELRPGRRVESSQAQAALRLIAAFEDSPMANQVEVKRVDVSAPTVLVLFTGQGSEITFGLDNFDHQLLRWQKVHEECLRQNKVIASLDLAVNENTPLRFQEASALPPAAPKNLKPQRTRKRNV
jgi:cell division septal protein FtsQ